MGISKKDDMKFTLRMNASDPAQVITARILNTKGHHISEFVARAVMAYTGRSTEFHED